MQANLDRDSRIKHSILNTMKYKANTSISSEMKILEFGAGNGDIMNAFLMDNYDCYGIDISKTGYKKFVSIDPTNHDRIHRYHIYDGTIVPFDSCFFDFIYCWFVTEHIKYLDTSIKEMARVCKQGGYIAIFTQDARSAYEGHTKTPWPPFLPVQFFPAYLDEYGWNSILPNASKKQIDEFLSYLTNDVFYVTEPAIKTILEYFGMRIVYSCQPDIAYDNITREIRTEEDARMAARYYKKQKEQGEWKMPTNNIILVAQKML